MRQRFLPILVFWSGFVTLGSELAASRLMAPFFGTSELVWAVLIGLILVYLSIGYWIGGRWADRSPFGRTLYSITTGAAFLLALVPVIATPVLRLSVRGFAELNGGLLVGPFVAVLLLFSAPLVLLGCVSPFAIRLSVADLRHAGQVAGRLYALSTLGSFLGALLPTLLLIPTIGTRATFFFFSLSLLALSLIGLMLDGARRRAMVTLGLSVLVLLLALATHQMAIKPQAGVLWEGESPYHYIRVVETAAGWRHLELNEGQGIHSVYRPGEALTGSVWDFFLLAPLFNPAPYDPFAKPRRWAVIGVAAGSTPRSIDAIYPDDRVDGVEIDPEVVAVGREFFALDTLLNLDVTVADGRRWLAQTPQRYDVVAIDAYRQPYIPFHLTTVEFFQQVHDRLTSEGVVAINVGRAPYDWRLVDALSATMREVFPSVFVVDVDDSYNSLVIATVQPSTLPQAVTNIESITDPALAQLGRRAQGHMRDAPRQGLIFTDDHAPVEQVIDLMIVRFAIGGGVEELR